MLDRHLPRIVNDSEQAQALPKARLFSSDSSSRFVILSAAPLGCYDSID
jgi:hypothetical protein